MIASEFLAPAYRSLTRKEHDSFERLYTSFIQKNSQLNLSAIRDESGIWEKHFYDSLLGAEFLERSGEKILDLGSGGGFPALPLAILFPGKQFFPLDSVGKKMNAVKEISDQLGLQNMFPLISRAEEFGRNQKYRERFDAVTIRAFASFPVALELALPFLKVQGVAILYRGPEYDPDDELIAEKLGAFVRNRKKTSLPSGDGREIWEVVKIYQTDKRFPRGNGVPKKHPLTLKDF